MEGGTVSGSQITVSLPANIVAAGGGNIVAAGGGNIVAAGGGNVWPGIVAAGGGNVVPRSSPVIYNSGSNSFGPLPKP